MVRKIGGKDKMEKNVENKNVYDKTTHHCDEIKMKKSGEGREGGGRGVK